MKAHSSKKSVWVVDICEISVLFFLLLTTSFYVLGSVIHELNIDKKAVKS